MPVADGGEVGGVVGVATVRLDHRHGDLAAGAEHHLPALVLLQETYQRELKVNLNFYCYFIVYGLQIGYMVRCYVLQKLTMYFYKHFY